MDRRGSRIAAIKRIVFVYNTGALRGKGDKRFSSKKGNKLLAISCKFDHIMGITAFVHKFLLQTVN